jgi:hypothetical protein
MPGSRAGSSPLPYTRTSSACKPEGEGNDEDRHWHAERERDNALGRQRNAKRIKGKFSTEIKHRRGSPLREITTLLRGMGNTFPNR